MVSAEDAVKVVDFVGDEASQAAVKTGDASSAVEVLVFDVDGQRSWNTTADVEEAQASLVLLVDVGAGFDHARVEQHDRLTAVWWTYQRRRSVDADLGCGQSHTFTEGVSRYGLVLIEDASHAAGATVSGRKVGSFGDLAAISMNGPKPLSAGEGGIVLTNDDELYYRVLLDGQYNKRCRDEFPTEHPQHRYAVTGTGLKLRIHPLAAALAAEQLPRLDDYLAGRRALAEKMRTRLRGLAGLTVPELPNDVAPSWYALALQHDPEQCDRIPTHRVVEALQAEGVDVDQPGSTRPLSDHPLFNVPNPAFPILPEGWPRYRPGQFPVADALHRHTLKLPVPQDDDALTEDYLSAFTKI